MTLEFLLIDDVLQMHEQQIEAYGGPYGVRDHGLLQSALAQPQATFDGEFVHDGLFAMAAAYLYHIVNNHPFVDGNKRTGLFCALVFLDINGVVIGHEPELLYNLTMAVAAGETGKQEIAAILADTARTI